MEPSEPASPLEYIRTISAEALKLVRYLFQAEHMGCKLLSSNTTKLHALLEEYARVAEEAVAAAYGGCPKLAPFVAGNQAAHATAMTQLTALRPLIKDEETLAANFEAVQGSLEGVLPATKAYLESVLTVQLPLAATALPPALSAQLAAGIARQQAAMAAEEEARLAAEAAAFAKTRAGRRLRALEDEKRREAARAKAEAEGGKKKKAAEEELDSALLSVKEAAAKRRVERSARAAAKAATSAASTPATIAGEAGQLQLLETLHL